MGEETNSTSKGSNKESSVIFNPSCKAKPKVAEEKPDSLVDSESSRNRGNWDWPASGPKPQFDANVLLCPVLGKVVFYCLPLIHNVARIAEVCVFFH